MKFILLLTAMWTGVFAQDSVRYENAKFRDIASVIFINTGIGYYGDKNGGDMDRGTVSDDDFYYSRPGPLFSMEFLHRFNFIAFSAKLGLLPFGMNLKKLNFDITNPPSGYVYREAYVKQNYSFSLNPFIVIGPSIIIEDNGTSLVLLKALFGFSHIQKPVYEQFIDRCPFGNCRGTFSYENVKWGPAYELSVVFLRRIGDRNFLTAGLSYTQAKSTANASWKYYDKDDNQTESWGFDGVDEAFEGVNLSLGLGFQLSR